MTSPERAAGYGVENVHYSFGQQAVLRGITFAVEPGEIHALVGMHNEGKSTLCGILTGRLAPDSGHVVVNGAAYPGLTPGKARELGVAGLSSRPRLYPRLTVLQNLMYGVSDRWLGFLPTLRYRRKFEVWLKDNAIDLPLSSPLHELPRDQWVLVEALSKLYRNPGLLVMDEALEELKQPWFNQLLALVRKRLANGMGMLMVTHKIEDALNLADRVSVMRGGNLVLTDSASSMERLNLIRMCYAQIDSYDDYYDGPEKFQELMRYTEAMLRDLPASVVIIGTNQHIRFVNRAAQRLFADELRGGGELFGGGNSRLRELVLAAVAEDRDEEHHAVPIASGARRIIADVRIQVLRENGAKVGTMVSIEDVSLREELRRRLVVSEQLASIGLLAAGVAHEVNNPLEILGNYLNYLRDDATSPDTVEVISHMADEIARIHEIVNNLVAHSGNRRADEVVDIMALARETCGLVQFHSGARSVEFVFDEGPGKALVKANSPELRQVFLNLVRNAVDAMPDGGTIRISSESGNSGETVLKVADTGPGIGLENPNDVFLPFVSTKRGEGVHQGLGLYIVYGIVEKYGGTITVRNPEEGGCEFTIAFPQG